jgi:hypothetical protein
MLILPIELVVTKVLLRWSHVFDDIVRLNLTIHQKGSLAVMHGKIVNMSAALNVTWFILM